jgi:hypothetical protein
MATPQIDAFHAHLDVCRQCRDNPFGLCRTGADLLFAAGSSVDAAILGKSPTAVEPTEICRRCGQEAGDGKAGTCDGYCDCPV